MGKKNKTVDLKPKADKISDEQLKKLQATISDMNRMHVEIGRIESQKHNALHQLAKTQDEISVMQDILMKEWI